MTYNFPESVSRVNTQTGDVALTAADVGALSVPYPIGAVHFDGANSSIVNSSLVAPDGGELAFSFWIRTVSTIIAKSIWAADPATNGTTFQVSQGGMISGSVTGDAGAHYLYGATGNTGIFSGDYVHVLGAVKTDLALGTKIYKLYLDDVDANFVKNEAGDTDPSFNVATNGLPFLLGDDTYGDGQIMDIADFWWAPNQSILVNGDIPQATRRKFISADGNPVNLGVDGSTPTGTAPAVFLHTDAGTQTNAMPTEFITNRGTGGTFTLVGTLIAATAYPPHSTVNVGLVNPMTTAGDLIGGGVSGAAARLANPGAGTFNLQSIEGVLTWTVA